MYYGIVVFACSLSHYSIFHLKRDNILQVMYVLKLKCCAIVHYFNVDKNLRRVALLYAVSKSALGRWVLEDTVMVRRPDRKKEELDCRCYFSRGLDDD